MTQQSDKPPRPASKLIRRRDTEWFEHAPFALAMFDQDMRYLIASQRLLDDFLPGRGDVIGRNHYEVFPECPERWRAAHRRALAGEVVREEADAWASPEGRTLFCRYEVRPWYADDGTIGGIALFVEDITARKEAEEELRRSEDQLRSLTAKLKQEVAERTAESTQRESRLVAIMDSAFSAIITIDSKGTIKEVNKRVVDVLGYETVELLGQNIKMIVPSPYREFHDGYLARYREERIPHIIGTIREVQAQRKDGSLIDVALSIAEVGHLGLYTGILLDISEQKQLQRRVLEIASEEQQRIGQELHDGVQQELTALSLFAGLAKQCVHDVEVARTRKKSDAKASDAAIRKLRDAIERLVTGLNESLGHVTELAHGVMPLPVDSGALPGALEALGASVRPTVACTCDCDRDTIIADPTVATHVYRIAQEALNNAVRHAKADAVHISLSASQGTIVLSVVDNGAGFDRSTVTGGMGLRTMEYRARLIGGALQIASSAARGTSVRCTFPHPIESIGSKRPSMVSCDGLMQEGRT